MEVRSEIKQEFQDQLEKQQDTIADLEYKVESLQWRLAESRAAEAALSGVISYNILRLREGHSCS